MFRIFSLCIVTSVCLNASQQVSDYFVDSKSLLSRHIHHEFSTPSGAQYSLVRATVDDAEGLKSKELRKTDDQKDEKSLEHRLGILRIYRAITANPLPIREFPSYIFGLYSIYEHHADKSAYVGELFVDVKDFYLQGTVGVKLDIDPTRKAHGIYKAAYDCIVEKVLRPSVGSKLPVLNHDTFYLIRNMYTMQWCMPICQQPLTSYGLL